MNQDQKKLAKSQLKIEDLKSQIKSLNALSKKLAKALEAAQEHLDYVGYGDSWERECARESKLEEKIDEALESFKSYNTPTQSVSAAVVATAAAMV